MMYLVMEVNALAADVCMNYSSFHMCSLGNQGEFLTAAHIY